MKFPKRAWTKYMNTLNQLNVFAAEEMREFYESIAVSGRSQAVIREMLIQKAWELGDLWGEASGAAACEYYEAAAALQRAQIQAATPARTATRREAAREVDKALARSRNPEVIGSTAGKLVKQAGADTIMQNAKRDNAYWAWVPGGGETCAFCIELASNGWLPASQAQMDGDHAEHIHANCMCTFAVRFGDDLDIPGYNPDIYKKIYDDAPGATSEDKLNAMRREFYAENKEEINAQKRDAYAKRQELNAPSAEEMKTP